MKKGSKEEKNGFVIYQSDFSLLNEMILDSSNENENILDWKLKLMEEPFIAEAEQVEGVLSNLNEYYNFYSNDTINTQTLKGSVVYSEKSKTKIKGRVRIIRDPKKEIINKNEILVATSTTPDFIDSIYNSMAVITDWGGLTSHAAIITRELKKTCIIGTNYATSVLKTGDVVEIDTKEGIIKILNKEE